MGTNTMHIISFHFIAASTLSGSEKQAECKHAMRDDREYSMYEDSLLFVVAIRSLYRFRDQMMQLPTLVLLYISSFSPFSFISRLSKYSFRLFPQ